MADYELSCNDETRALPQTFSDALPEHEKTPRDFAVACGISLARACRLLKGGFIQNSLDLNAIVELLRYDPRYVTALRERHNQQYHQCKDSGTVWSVPSEEGTTMEIRSKPPNIAAVGAAANIARGAQAHNTGPPDFPSNPAMCKRRSSGGCTSDVQLR